MSYIEKIKRGNKNYYYLTKNIRINQSKWKKVRSYMGDKTPSKTQINRSAKEIEEKTKKEVK